MLRVRLSSVRRKADAVAEAEDCRSLVSSFSHKVVISKCIVLICVHVRNGDSTTADANKSRLRLGSLALLARLFGSLLLPHLLVAKRGQGARDFLDLIARQVLGQLLGKLLKEGHIVGLLGVVGQDGNQSRAQLLELSLGSRIEDGKRGQVDGAVRIFGIDHNRSAR